MYKTGIEIEVKLKNGVRLDDVLQALESAGISCNDQRHTWTGELNGCDWKVVYDSTVDWEFVSAPMVGMKTIEKRVMEIIPVLQQYCRVDTDCGLHVHFDIINKYHFRRRVNVSTIDGKYRAMMNKPCRLFTAELLRNYRYFQPVIDAFVSESRRGERSYVGPISNRWDVTTKNDCKMFAENNGGYYPSETIQLQNNKYKNVNIINLSTYGTVEYRQHQGTLNATKILNWIRFCERFTTRAWDRNYKDLDCENFDLSVDGIMDFLGFGKCNRSIREYYRGRAMHFGQYAIAHPERARERRMAHYARWRERNQARS